MGKRIKVSQPAAINTTLSPLIDSLEIKESDTLEQWFYVNTGAYSPDRSQTPLLLTPSVSAIDQETGTSYTPSFYISAWYYQDPSSAQTYPTDTLWPGAGWVRITNIEDTQGADYVLNGANLIVKKNVQPASNSYPGQALCFSALYKDPRDEAQVYLVRGQKLLVTSKDATIDTIIPQIIAPTSTLFDPTALESVSMLEMLSAPYTFTAKVYDRNSTDITSGCTISWYAKLNKSKDEVLIETLDCYTNATQETGKGQGTDTITIDAMFFEQLDLVLRVKKTGEAELRPDKAYASIIWTYPKIDPITMCDQGGGVDSKERLMTFRNIINKKGETLSEAKIQRHFQANWKRRKPNATVDVFVDMGWGQSVTISSNTLRQTSTYTTPVHSDVYILGPYERVTYSGTDVTYNNTQVYQRS